jgi:hypothetical protein
MFHVECFASQTYNVILGDRTIARNIRTLREAEAYVMWEARRRNLKPVYTNMDGLKVTLH